MYLCCLLPPPSPSHFSSLSLPSSYALTHTHYPAHTFSSKPHTLPTNRILHPILVYLPLLNQPALSQHLQSLTKHHFHLLPPFLQLPPPQISMHCHSCYCIPCPHNLLPIFIWDNSNFLHAVRPPVHHTSTAYSILGLARSSHSNLTLSTSTCPFTLLIHDTLPIHSSVFFSKFSN